MFSARQVAVSALAVAALLALADAQSFSQENCQKAAQGASKQISQALRKEMKKFQEKITQLAQNSFNVDQITSQVDNIADQITSTMDTSGNVDMQQLTQLTTQISTSYIQLGTSLFNTRAPLEAYTAYFNFLYASGQKITEIMRGVQQACTPSN